MFEGTCQRWLALWRSWSALWMMPLRGPSAERPGLQLQLENHFIHLFYHPQICGNCRQNFPAAIHSCHPSRSGAHQFVKDCRDWATLMRNY